MKAFKDFLFKARKVMLTALTVLGAIICFFLFLRATEPILTPIVHISFYVIGTMVAFFSRKSAKILVVGVIIYALSGLFDGQYVAGFIGLLGFLLWFYGASLGFKYLLHSEELTVTS